jgi:hypothetical protein
VTAKRYPSTESFRRKTLSTIAKEIGRTPVQTQKLLHKAGFLGLHPSRRIGTRAPLTYPSAAVEVLKAMIDVPARDVPDPGSDWLSAYEGEAT